MDRSGLRARPPEAAELRREATSKRADGHREEHDQDESERRSGSDPGRGVDVGPAALRIVATRAPSCPKRGGGGPRLLLGRLGQALGRRSAPADDPGRLCFAPFRSNIRVTTSGQLAVAPLRATVAEVGADHILLVVDYPFARNEAARAFLDTRPVSPAERKGIAHRNAEPLPRL